MNTETDIEKEYKHKRNIYWKRLRTAWEGYFMAVGANGTFEGFKKYMVDQWGLEVNMVGGNIDTTYKVVNEAKHTMFILKYGNEAGNSTKVY